MSNRALRVLSFALAAPLVAAPAFAQAPPSPPPPLPVAPPPALSMELTTLRLMREKGLISAAEYDSAMRDIADSSGARGGDAVTFTVAKLAATLYGVVEADAIWDSTQSLEVRDHEQWFDANIMGDPYRVQLSGFYIF